MESRSPPVQTGNPSGPGFVSAGLSTGLGASVSTKPIDRSRNVIIFGVPENRSLLDTENLVRQAFEFAVGRKIELDDCQRLGKFNPHQEKSRPLIVKLASVWDQRLLLNTKYKLRQFKGAQLFAREDQAPEDCKRNDAKSKTSVGRKPDNGVVQGNPNAIGYTDATPKVLSSHIPSDGIVHGNPITTADNGLQIEQSN